ncbi:MAG: alkaline phosphatase family protein, partial [Alphaproteobacteria bacterium]|nr:alkaline phosphatase family protein [Alphaproteobacteria bacterium]
AETEKYPHVTYFFNGGFEGKQLREDHILIPSPKVATYDLLPEMAAQAVFDETRQAIVGQEYDLIVLNFANADMVGHTGQEPAVIEAIKVLDDYVASLAQLCLDQGWIMLITADHGNAEQSKDPLTQEPHTAHTTNLVPFILVDHVSRTLKPMGTLSDIAPTILALLDIEIPEEMTGQSLI